MSELTEMTHSYIQRHQEKTGPSYANEVHPVVVAVTVYEPRDAFEDVKRNHSLR